MHSRLFSFVAGEIGPWHIEHVHAVKGEGLPLASRLQVCTAERPHPDSPPRAGEGMGDGMFAVAVESATMWTLRGITSNERYVTRDEKQSLVARQQGLGRPESTCAALIPIRKSDAWWALPQDERRKILEERSAHIKIGLEYLPAIARRLHHCRDLGTPEPFDFITWFEFAPADVPAFDRLLAELRASEEWQYVEREVDVRLMRT